LRRIYNSGKKNFAYFACLVGVMFQYGALPTNYPDSDPDPDTKIRWYDNCGLSSVENRNVIYLRQIYVIVK